MAPRRRVEVNSIIFLLFAAGLSLSSSEECLSGELDAITLTSDGKTYAFKGSFVVQLNDDGNDVVPGYPKRICDVFPGLPSNIDAAVHWQNRKTYFFKGSQYWRMSGTSLDDGYPLSISDHWPGLPNDIDAAVVWGGNRKAYFFKGTKYWRYNPTTDSTEDGDLDINTHWPGYNQGSVDAALQWSNGRTYLFKGEHYWRYNDGQDRVDSGYPLWTTKEWFGCSTNGPTTSIEAVCVHAGCSDLSIEECLSGELDAITLTSDGKTYAFKGSFVVQLNDEGNDVVPGYPKRICDVFPGLPSNIDAAVHWQNRKTYFFKGSQYWRMSGTSLDDGYPLSISDHWPGLPNDIDAAVVWGGNRKAYFFKGTKYWRYNPTTDSTEDGDLDINTHWPGYNQGSVDAALQWSNGRTYLFKGEHYWRYNDGQDRVDSGYPLWTTKEWFGCPTNGPTTSIEAVCVHAGCSGLSMGCMSGRFDAITRTEDGDTYVFKDNLVAKLNASGTEIERGYPKPICAVFPGLPTNLDAAVHWTNGKTYFFRGDQYWRTTGTSVDCGYPIQISAGWPGLPNDIDAAVVWGENSKGYFFKGTKYWRYNPTTDSTEDGDLDINTHWPGYNQGSVDAALQWSNGRTYLFKGEHYWRYNDGQDRVDSGYPLWTSRQWFGCPTDGPTILIDEVCVPDACSDSFDLGCVSGKLDAITRTSGGNTYAFKDNLVAKLNAAGTEIASGYPKPICAVFPGLPSNLDAAVYWTNGKTYFFKGDQYWRTTGTSIDCGYPIQISDGWHGLPNDIDAAVVWGENNKGYFFKGTKYWRYTSSLEDGNLDINTYWPGYNQGSVDAALQWSNGRTYLFKCEQYWRYNDGQDRVDSGYPLWTTRHWFDCPTDGPTIPMSKRCLPIICL